MGTSRTRGPLGLLACAALLVGGALGCGGDDDGGLLSGQGDTGAEGGGDGDDGGLLDGVPHGNPMSLVQALYRAIGQNDPGTACGLFSPSGEAELLEDTGMPSCEAAIDLLHQEIDDPSAFDDPTVEIHDLAATELDEWCGGNIDVDTGDGNDLPGAFTYAQQPSGDWLVIGFNTTECP